MRCRTAQRQMALAVGEDLPQAEAVELNRHLATCSTCQQAWSKHQACFTALQSSRVEPVVSLPKTTVWPGLARRIQRRALTPHRVVLNGWIGSLVVMSASILVFVFSLEEEEYVKPTRPRRVIVTGTPVVHPPDPALAYSVGRSIRLVPRVSAHPNSGEL
jgi:anti-sigma factor RsiW